jgi:hypothetical protein
VSKIKIGGIVKDLHLTLISLVSASDSSLSTTELLEELGQAGINVSMIVQLAGEDGGELTRLTVWEATRAVLAILTSAKAPSWKSR